MQGFPFLQRTCAFVRDLRPGCGSFLRSLPPNLLGGRGGGREKNSGSSHPPPKLLEKFSKHVAPWSRKTSLEERKRRVRAELRAGAGGEEEEEEERQRQRQGKGVCWRGVVAMESRCFGCRSCQGSACVCKKRSLSQSGLGGGGEEHHLFLSFSASVCGKGGVPHCRPRAADLGPP